MNPTYTNRFSRVALGPPRRPSQRSAMCLLNSSTADQTYERLERLHRLRDEKAQKRARCERRAAC